MNRRTLLRLGILLLLTVLDTATLTAQPPPRLIADNRTASVVEVWMWNGQSWGFVSRIAPRNWQAFPNARVGSVWRAVFGKASRQHTVSYAYDQSYGGYQSVWWIQ